MTLLALSKTQEAGGFIALAVALGVVGFFLLLPRPSGRIVSAGIAALVASAAVFASWVYRTFGNPLPDVIGTALFWFFSAGALIFGAVLVVQKNPARGAIAFAFVILSTCGLFLLLAAPFLMAATIIIYAGAIIVTFMFVLMLSHAEGPSDENNRSREPLYGGFAGFAFTGLVLFALYQTSQANEAVPGVNRTASRLPMPVLTADEYEKLAGVIPKIEEAEKTLDGDIGSHKARAERCEAFENAMKPVKVTLAGVVDDAGRNVPDGSLRRRLEKNTSRNSTEELYRIDPQARDALERARIVRELTHGVQAKVENNLQSDKPDVGAAKAEVRKLRDAVVILQGVGQLPARNVANLGFSLYSEHLLAIELAGTLLLVATVGAVAVAHRKRVAK